MCCQHRLSLFIQASSCNVSETIQRHENVKITFSVKRWHVAGSAVLASDTAVVYYRRHPACCGFFLQHANFRCNIKVLKIEQINRFWPCSNSWHVAINSDVKHLMHSVGVQWHGHAWHGHAQRRRTGTQPINNESHRLMYRLTPVNSRGKLPLIWVWTA